MNESILIVFLAVLSQLSLIIDGQYHDWGCDHWGQNPVNVCFGYSDDIDKMFSCNGTDYMTEIHYNAEFSDNCQNTSAIEFSMQYDLNSSDFGECGFGGTCGYWGGFCDGLLTIGYITIDVCYSSDVTGTSFRYDCNNAKLTTYSYESDDCTGKSQKDVHDYMETYTDEENLQCYIVCVKIVFFVHF